MTFLNLYLPLRLHPSTRNVVNQIIQKHKNALTDGNLNQEGETFGRYED